MTLSAALLCSCGTPAVSTSVEKQVVVNKDSNGKIISTTVTEKITQPLLAQPVQLEYLTGLEPMATAPLSSPHSH